MDLKEFNFTHPMVFFDLETTGLNVVTDRIVQFAAVKYSPGKDTPEELVYFVNPQMAIDPQAAAVHGISDERVANEATFNDLADEIYEFIGEADLSGYNIKRFDVPMLMEEFDRAGIRFRMDERKLVDVQEIFFKMEPRTLAGALRFYSGEEMTNAHDALADVQATIKVLAGQVKKYKGITFKDIDGAEVVDPIQADVDALAAFTLREGQLDATNRLRRDTEGEIVFNFGKHKGRTLKEVFSKERSYYHWLQDKDFSIQVKEISRGVWESMND
ncbi:MAG: exonuclease domain-containing protein [Saprospiraceae bacterium]